MSTKSDDVEKDPIMRLGYGIVAYRNLMWTMTLALCVFTILAIPSLVIYSNGTGYAYTNKRLQGREIYSLGNMGYSSVQCSSIPMGIGVLSLSCPYGQIGEILDYGVNDVHNGVDTQLCANTEANQNCKPTNPAIMPRLN